MKHLPSDKYTIAWFKLAEFISRGEKEKALGIYRLLALSINDDAFVSKLEGDILCSFNDTAAEDKYYKAAILYQKAEKYIESIAIYENLSYLNTEASEYLYKLLDLYNQLNLKPKIIATIKRIFFYKLKKKEFNAAIELLEKIQDLSYEDINILDEELVFNLIDNNFDKTIIFKYINKIFNDYFSQDKKNNLQLFLAKLEVTNNEYYREIIKQLK